MKLICGPMATISHVAFRILVEKFGGADEYFTEMINAGSLLNMGPFEPYYINPAPKPSKIVWQLTGNDGEKMARAAEILLELPGLGIDINMGCSAPDVYKTGAGIAWMTKSLCETREMVRLVGQTVEKYNKKLENENQEKKRFSVKLRLGDDDFSDEGFFAFTDMLVENGVNLLTLHPRTKKEKLTRPPRYEYCHLLCQRYKKDGIELYINGNIKDSASLEIALSKCPNAHGVMISRAAVQKPWIFGELGNCGICKNEIKSDGMKSVGANNGEVCNGEREKKKVSIDMLSLCLEYIDNIEKYQPKEFYKTRLQRFFSYFCMNFKFSHYASTKFLNAATKGNEVLREVVRSFFDECPEERIKILYT